MNKFILIKPVAAIILIFFAGKVGMAQPTVAKLKILFEHSANGKAITLRDSNYINSTGEHYQVTRLKYYISNVNFGNPVQNVQLIDVAGRDSIVIDALPGKYNQLHFTLGVDSLLNCSGAQTGALDPLNGMFWTWNSGYIFFKLEGYSPSSTADLHRIEHHIGGYKAPNKVATEVTITLPGTFTLKANETTIINVNVNLDDYWNGTNKLSIADNALIMVPGELAKKAAANFAAMFSLKQSK